MKKLTIGLLAIIVLVPFLGLKEVHALTLGDYEYTDNGDGTATIIKYKGTKKDVVIPSKLDGLTVTIIEEYAFSDNQLTSVVISNSVTSIGHGAFERNKLTSVIIPDSVTNIGGGAFAGNNLASLTIPNSVTSIGDWAFRNNQLSEVKISNSLTSIGDGVFHANELTNVTIPNSVTSIGYGAFENNNLEEVFISSSVTSIGSEAFRDNNLTTVVIPERVKTIGDHAFDDNELTNVTILNSETTFIGNYVFYVKFPKNPADLTIIGYDPSTAKDLAESKGYTFKQLVEQSPKGDTEESQDLRFNLEGGDLTLISSPIQSFGNIKLKAQPEAYKTSFTQSLNIKDLRGTQEGWRLDVSATQFEVVKPSDGFASGTSAYKLPKGSLSLTPLANISRVGPGTGSLPTSKLSNSTVIDDGSVTVASAGQGEGMGEFSLTFPNDALSFVVDATTAKVDKINYPDGGTPYEATITWNLVSAP